MGHAENVEVLFWANVLVVGVLVRCTQRWSRNGRGPSPIVGPRALGDRGCDLAYPTPSGVGVGLPR